METISQSLQPYKGLVGEVASYVTIAQFFSGVFVCKDIYKKRNTKGISATPFLGGVIIGTLMLKYGLLLGDPAMTKVNVAAIFLNILYSIFYYQYSEDKFNEVLKPLSVGIALVAVLLGYAGFESPENLEYRFGLIVTVLMLLLLGAPLMGLKEIIAKKDASSIPFPITFMGAIVTFLWLLYGLILQNNFMIVQNLIGYVLCIVQLVLLFLYPGGENSGSSQGQSKKKKGTKKDYFTMPGRKTIALYGAGFSNYHISAGLHIPSSSVPRIIHKYKETAMVERIPRNGRNLLADTVMPRSQPSCLLAQFVAFYFISIMQIYEPDF